MEYDAALKRKEIFTPATTWMNLENITLHENKPDIKGKILYDSTYMKSLEELDPQRQKEEWWVPWDGGGEMGS